MRRVALFAHPRPAATNAAVAAFLLLSFFTSIITTTSPQQYIVCKEYNTHRCITLQLDFNVDVADAKKLYSDSNDCFISTTIPYSGNHVRVTTLDDSSKRTLFCQFNKIVNVGALNGTTLKRTLKGLYRVRRNASFYPQGRYRGQTQSQYLAIDRGSGKDEGKAEAHSAADSSRATVSGNSGMGQAQSQSIFDPSCEDCLGRSDLGAASLKRRPGDTINQGGAPGTSGVGNVPNGGGGAGPSQIDDPRNRGYGLNPNQGGKPGGDYSGGNGHPGGDGGFGPGRDGTQGGSTMYPSQGHIPGGANNGALGPNSQSVFGTSPDGSVLGIRPPYLYNQNGLPNGNNNGGLGGNNAGNHAGVIPTGTSGYGSGGVPDMGDGSRDTSRPGAIGSYPGATVDSHGGNSNIMPGKQGYGFGPGGSNGGGDIPPGSLTQPQNGGTYGPGPNGGSGNTGIYPNRGGTQSGFPGTSGAFPGGSNSNWPTVSGSFRGPDGLNYYCCVASPTGPQFSGNGYKPAGLPNQYTPGTSGSQGPSGHFIPGPGSGQGQYSAGSTTGQGTGGQFAPGAIGVQGSNGQFGPSQSGGQGVTGQYLPGRVDGQYGPVTSGGQIGPGTGGQFGPGNGGAQFGPGAGGGQGPIGQYGPLPGSEQGSGGQFRPGTMGGQGPGGQFTPGVGGVLGPSLSGQYGPATPGGGRGSDGQFRPGTGVGQLVPGVGGGGHVTGLIDGSGIGSQYIPGVSGGQFGPGTIGSSGGPYTPSNAGSQSGQVIPGTGGGSGPFGPGSGGGQYGPGVENAPGPAGQFVPGGSYGASEQFVPGIVGGQGRSPSGQYGPGAGIGPGSGGQFSPGTEIGTGGQVGPGMVGGSVISFGPGTGGAGTPLDFGAGNGQGIGGQYSPGVSNGQGTGGQFGPGIGTGGQYSPGISGQFAPGTAGGPNSQAGPGTGGSGGQFIPGTVSATGGQYGPGISSGSGGQMGPGTGSSTGGQYGPGTSGGQIGPSTVGGPGSPFGPGIGGQRTGGHFGPGTSDNSNGQIRPGAGGQGTGGQFGPNVGQGSGGQFIPGSGSGGQYVPGGGQGNTGQYGPGSGGGSGGQYGPNSGGGINGQYVPGSGSGTGGQYGPGNSIGQSPGGQFGPVMGGGSVGQFGPGSGSGQGSNGQVGPGAGTGGQFGPGTGGQLGPGTRGEQYGPGAEGRQFGPGDSSQGTGGQLGLQGSGQGTGGLYGPSLGPGATYPGVGYNPYGDQYGSARPDQPIPVNQGGTPQNVIDPNSITDGDDSEAEASVNQAANGTVASASSKGGNEKGRAQTHVHGTYTGSGSFSAQAEISGENKAANSEVTGDKKGASSTAQGSGRNNKSQANVKLGSETGSVQTGSQSEGVLHSSNSQVQGSIKGGMADAQARGPGSTSSQAQIGFTPYKEGDKSHESQKTPFVGGGISTAQSSGRTGMSQSQLHGTFKYGITYNGAAQAGASLDKDAVFPNRLPFDKIDVNDESNKNINVNAVNDELTEKPGDFTPAPPQTELPTTEVPFETDVGTEVNKEEPLNQPEDSFDTHKHADHHSLNDPTLAPPGSPPVESRRSFQPTYNTNNGDYEYSTDKDDSPPDDYDVDDGFGPEGNDPSETDQGYSGYNEFSRDPEATHQSLNSPKRKGLEVRQTTGENTQHILLGSLADHDAEITQRNSERPDEGRIYQPGERVPGTGGYTIPIGFTGSVKSVASKEKTYVVGSKDSPSQAQTVSLTPGSGRVKYKYPTHGRNINPKNLRSLYSPKTDDTNRYVSVSKSVTRALDGENNVRKQYSHTYYTKSSSCGYFTFTCTMVSSAEGRKKVCKPKMPTNPDGTPMRCN